MADRTTRGSTLLPPPPQSNLLEYITRHSLDEGYAHVASQRAGRGDARARRPGRSALVVFALFGVLVATAGVQTARTAGVDATSHDQLVGQVNSGRELLERSRASLAAIETEVADARADNRTAADALADQLALQRRLGIAAGSVAVRGEGVRITVNDAPGATQDAELVLDRDLRDIVSGLWQAGAEAVSVNGQRIGTLSAIDYAGTSITVNYVDLVPPYVVLAIGDRDRLPARFVESSGGTAWLNAQQTFGQVFDMEGEDSVTIPPLPSARLQLRQAQTRQPEGVQ